MSVFSFIGNVCTTGPGINDGVRNAAEPCTYYSYIRFEDSNGGNKYLERIFIPSYLDSLISVGTNAKYHIVEYNVPTPFGSKPFRIVYAIEINEKCFSAIEEAKKIFSTSKLGALKLFLFGLITLPLWGIGLIFIIQGVRLSFLSLPDTEMVKGLEGENYYASAT